MKQFFICIMIHNIFPNYTSVKLYLSHDIGNNEKMTFTKKITYNEALKLIAKFKLQIEEEPFCKNFFTASKSYFR